ncbi:uroporphyrinogen-III C-methyltransferase [Betaproteobacteria bacterium GR16-43]|nr:uroporphyrinogen-III C-methyltransferase [Betaproteobacteria bacterium GR16-43]
MGKVYLVGAGPGAPDLLTLRAARLLERADIVFHDALVHADTLKLATQARLVDVGKRNGKVSTEQRFTNRALVEAAKTHAVVVRLKGGDPMLFGRAHEELEALREAGIEAEVVPGITAALAASASLGLSLTRRGLSRHVAFVTPRTGADQSPTEWLGAASSADTVALYMAATQSQAVAADLIAAGRPATTPAIFVENVSLPNERRVVTTLQALRNGPTPSFEGPAILLVGEVFRELSLSVMEHEAEIRLAVTERCQAKSA